MNNKKVKNILLTGATGFLGSHLLRRILEKTNYSVIVIKRSFSNVFRIEKELLNTRVRYYNIDKTALSDIFNSNKIDIIIHCATEYGRSKENSAFSVLETNLMFPISILEKAVENNVECFINTDSYFNKENMSYSYLLNYSLSKKSLNLWLKNYSKKIKIINMVLEHIYGKDDGKNKFTTYLFQKIALERVSAIDLTYGDQKRDFIYVEDVCDAYLKAIDFSASNKFRYRSFNVGTGKAVSIKKFASYIKETSSSSTFLNFGAIPYRDDEIMLSVADTSEIENIGFKPAYTFQTGINETLRKMVSENKAEETNEY